MMMGMEYGASWSMPLTLRVVAAMFLTPFVAFALFLALRLGLRAPLWLCLLLAAIPVGLALAFFMRAIRGFVVTREAVFVRRLIWSSYEPLDGLSEARVDETAMQGVRPMRSFVGGFGTGGWFWSARFGRFRGYLTNVRRLVVLKFDRGTVLLSPDDPDAFVRHIESFRPVAPPPSPPARAR
jgi:hypothetical protein